MQLKHSKSMFFSSAGRGRRRENVQMMKNELERIHFTLHLREWQDIWVVSFWMFQINKVFFYAYNLSAHCLLLNFVSADCRKWLPSKHLSNFYYFQYLFRQVCFVLVLTTPNHKARNRYPEMVIARTYKDWIRRVSMGVVASTVIG